MTTESAAPATGNSNESGLVENRRERRYATSEPADVYLLDMNNLRLRGMLREISTNGMRIELDMPAKTGDRLEVLLQNKAIVFAEVRYCQRSGHAYQVDSRIDDVYYPKGSATARSSKSAPSEPVHEQLAHRIRLVEKGRAHAPERHPSGLSRTSERAVDPGVNQGRSVKSRSRGSHLDRNDVDNLLRLRLSETKAALLERHLASCDQCLDLVLLTLEERAAASLRKPQDAPAQV
jgi:PilZ domain